VIGNTDVPPKTSDGKPIFLPNLFPGDVEVNFAGAGDSATVRGDGSAFMCSQPTEGDASVTWSFKDWVYVAGGEISHRGCRLGDHISFKVTAPATVATAAAGDGNANKVAVGGGLNVIVPAAGDGAWNVAEADRVPIPAYNAEGVATGYWTWNEPDEGKGVVAAGAPGTSSYNLFDQPLDLIRWATKLHLLGDGQIDLKLSSVKPKKLLPHWTCHVDLHGDGASGALNEVTWLLFTARRKTT
jgi:hypothetical protein